MRVLPQTIRGTGRLAGAVWLALCAAAWWALPVQPRAVWRPPGLARAICLRPDGRGAIAWGRPDTEGCRLAEIGPVWVWDAATGRVTERLDRRTEFLQVIPSPD